MSRIHDALKKAELEQGAEVDPARLNHGRAVELPPISDPNAPTFAAPFTFEGLLKRCPQEQWLPDTSTMLFFGSGNVQGQEAFRTLRSRLFQVREKRPLKSILVAGATGDEGKSFVAANLAQVLVQQHGQRALLIDADLRQPKLHAVLGTSPMPGLTDYLMGNCEEFAILRRGPMENLFFVPAGRTVMNPLELIAGPRMGVLMSQMEPAFDWIIVNSSPAVEVSDAGQLANNCDGVLLVVRSEVTPYDWAQKARDEFYRDKIVGVVLNGVDAKSLPQPGNDRRLSN